MAIEFTKEELAKHELIRAEIAKEERLMRRASKNGQKNAVREHSEQIKKLAKQLQVDTIKF